MQYVTYQDYIHVLGTTAVESVHVCTVSADSTVHTGNSRLVLCVYTYMPLLIFHLMSACDGALYCRSGSPKHQ